MSVAWGAVVTGVGSGDEGRSSREEIFGSSRWVELEVLSAIVSRTQAGRMLGGIKKGDKE